MVVINWYGYECKSDVDACTKVVPFIGKQVYTNDGNIESILHVTAL